MIEMLIEEIILALILSPQSGVEIEKITITLPDGNIVIVK